MQRKSQPPLSSLSLRRDYERGVWAGNVWHIEFDLGLPLWIRLSEVGMPVLTSFNLHFDLRLQDRIAILFPHSDLQLRAPARQPGLGVDQFQQEFPLLARELRLFGMTRRNLLRRMRRVDGWRNGKLQHT